MSCNRAPLPFYGDDTCGHDAWHVIVACTFAADFTLRACIFSNASSTCANDAFDDGGDGGTFFVPTVVSFRLVIGLSF